MSTDNATTTSTLPRSRTRGTRGGTPPVTDLATGKTSAGSDGDPDASAGATPPAKPPAAKPPKSGGRKPTRAKKTAGAPSKEALVGRLYLAAREIGVSMDEYVEDLGICARSIGLLVGDRAKTMTVQELLAEIVMLTAALPPKEPLPIETEGGS